VDRRAIATRISGDLLENIAFAACIPGYTIATAVSLAAFAGAFILGE
jgi:hypothetical protein